MPSDIGRCVKIFGKPIETKEPCEFFEMRDDKKTALSRQKSILETLSNLNKEINNLLLILLSDRQEYND